MLVNDKEQKRTMARKTAGLTDAEMLERYKRIQANNSRAGKIAAQNMTAEQRHLRAKKAAAASAAVRSKGAKNE